MKHSNIAFFIPHLGCPHTCSFCNQRSISGQTLPPTGEEIRRTCEQALRQVPNRSQAEIAFFGGSFTAVEPCYMRELLEAATPFCGRDGFAGVRISTRPDCVPTQMLETLRQYPVTAIELGVQSLDDYVLTLNGRGHTAAEAEEAAGRVRAYGFSLGLQMMTGLYGDSKESTYRTAERIIALAPDTVRIYPTVVLRGTRLAALYESGQYRPPTVEETIPVAADLMTMFAAAGISVIRVGLHASVEVERDLLAGAYHPAFRELCEGEICFRKLREALAGLDADRAVIAVAPRAVSRFVGQSKINKKRLNQLGYDVTIKQDSHLSGFDFEIREVDHATKIVGAAGV